MNLKRLFLFSGLAELDPFRASWAQRFDLSEINDPLFLKLDFFPPNSTGCLFRSFLSLGSGDTSTAQELVSPSEERQFLLHLFLGLATFSWLA